MSSHQYQRVAANDADDTPETHHEKHLENPIPASPPPSFRSRTSSPTSHHLLSEHDPLASDADRTLADTFGAPSDGEGSDSEDESGDDRQRLMRGSRATSRSQEDGTGNAADDEPRPGVERRVTELPVFAPSAPTITTRRVVGRGTSANDGVFANLNAKPERGEKTEEQPPSYEQAAADATPPYWETTILAPGMVSDEVYVDGLPVGSVFSFIWNGMISMSFQLVGFLLTYLLHTTHAAKNGSRAGLGITLVQYGFYMKGSGGSSGGSNNDNAGGDQQFSQPPPDPNSHDFDPQAMSGAASAAAAAAMEGSSTGGAGAAKSGLSGIASSEWLAYILMVIGWFILIRAVSDFFKARRHEQLVLQSPDRGLGVAVVAEGERAETVV